MTRTLLCILTSAFLFAGTGCGNTGNTAPEIISILPDLSQAETGTTVHLVSVVEDDDMSEVVYQWESSCGSFEGDVNQSSADWTAPDEEGECTVTLTVSDGEFSDETTFNVTVWNSNVTASVSVGVYYYPWYGGNDFHGGKYLREHLVPVQTPVLGEYNDRDAQVISKHLEWSRYAGINLWVSSWWGPGKMTDVTLKDHILNHPDLGNTKVALFYETTSRIPDFTDLSRVSSDIEYMATTYFDHPNYFRIDGRPVLFVYVTRALSSRGMLAETVNLMRDAASEAGYDIYIVGDQVFGQPPSSTEALALLDAATNYDVYGSSGAKIYATQRKVDNYYLAQAGWKSKSLSVGTAFIPAAAPGFNDAGVRDGHTPLSRKLSESDAFGSLFRAMTEHAVTLVDSTTGNLMMVTSWNEWHEDTQIEPLAVSPATAEDDSGSQDAYTYGLEYEGYGMLYLDILKDIVFR